MKFAFLSHALPPSWSGQSMVIARLLRDFDHSLYCLVSGTRFDKTSSAESYTSRLPAKYYWLPSGFFSRKGPHTGWSRAAWELLRALGGIARRGYRLAGIVKREHCEVVIGCTGDLWDLPSAYLASRLSGCRFFAYIFDDYTYRWYLPMHRWLAQHLEALVLKKAAGVIVPNAALKDELWARHKVSCTVIHNSCEVSSYDGTGPRRSMRYGSEVHLVYTGAVYEAHYDAFHNLLAAMKTMRHFNVRLHVYTAIDPIWLDSQGISERVVIHPHLPLAQMPRIQLEADVLFLPLAFNSPYPEVIRTSTPGKFAEYLAAGRPILVHAPTDSFVAEYCRKHECGLVVDMRDPNKLAELLDRLLADDSLQHRLAANAKARARLDFDVSIARARFAELLKLS